MELSENNVKIFGVSFDSPEKLKSFKSKYQLPFTLISDEDKSISKTFGAKGLFFPKRKTIVINQDGIVEHVFEKVSIESHPQDIINLINQIESGK